MPWRADVDPRPGGHLPVHREPELLEPAELVPVGPVGRPGSSWRSAPAAPTRACGTRRPACPTARAASRRRRGVRSVARTIASKASQRRAAVRCRRRRPGRRGARPPRDRGCSCSIRSAASCGQPRQLSVRPPVGQPGPRIADGRRVTAELLRSVALDGVRAARRSATSSSAAESSGDSQRSGPGPGAAARTDASAAPVPGAGHQRGAEVERRGRADDLDREDASAGCRPTGAACGRRPSPSTRGPPASRWSAASRCSPAPRAAWFSATIAACV